MLDIIPGILGESDLIYFKPETYNALSSIINMTLASYFLSYLNNPEADKEIVSTIPTDFIKIVEAASFHKVIEDKKIIECVDSYTPHNISEFTPNLDDIIEKLTFLKDNFNMLRISYERPPAKDYNEFFNEMKCVVHDMYAQGTHPTYPDILTRITTNRRLFFDPTVQTRYTGLGKLISRKSDWLIVLYGCRWFKYCKEHNIPQEMRGIF